jgi:hypothetical protein
MNVNELWWLFALVFLVAGTLGYFLGWTDAKRKSKKSKTTTITIALDPSIKQDDIIELDHPEKGKYKVCRVNHVAGGMSPYTEMIVERKK